MYSTVKHSGLASSPTIRTKFEFSTCVSEYTLRRSQTTAKCSFRVHASGVLSHLPIYLYLSHFLALHVYDCMCVYKGKQMFTSMCVCPLLLHLPSSYTLLLLSLCSLSVTPSSSVGRSPRRRSAADAVLWTAAQRRGYYSALSHLVLPLLLRQRRGHRRHISPKRSSSTERRWAFSSLSLRAERRPKKSEKEAKTRPKEGRKVFFFFFLSLSSERFDATPLELVSVVCSHAASLLFLLVACLCVCVCLLPGRGIGSRDHSPDRKQVLEAEARRREDFPRPHSNSLCH